MPCELEKKNSNLDRQMVEFWLQLCAHKRAVSECIIIKKNKTKIQNKIKMWIIFNFANLFRNRVQILPTTHMQFFFVAFCIWAAERCDYDDADDIHRKYTTKKSYQPRPWQWECVFFFSFNFIFLFSFHRS